MHNQLVTVAIGDQRSAYSALLLGMAVLADLLLRDPPGLGQQRIVFQATLQRTRLDAPRVTVTVY